MKIILTGATGMVGEGVLMTCVNRLPIEEILVITRKPIDSHSDKVKNLVIANFSQLADHREVISGYDATFFCAGVSSVGLKEEAYTKLTFDLTIQFAQEIKQANPDHTFIYVSGTGTDSTEKGRIMWARVKGKTENYLQTLGFKAVYNFRPGAMLPVPGQMHIKPVYKFLMGLIQVIHFISPRSVLYLHQVADAMIQCSLEGYPKAVLEISDIHIAAQMK